MAKVNVDVGTLALMVFHLNRDHMMTNEQVAASLNLSIHQVETILRTGEL